MKNILKLTLASAVLTISSLAFTEAYSQASRSNTGSNNSSMNSSGTSSSNSNTGTSSGSTHSNGTSRMGTSNSTSDTDTSSDSIMNWDTENTYWRGHYSTRPYYNTSRNYSIYEPAYRYGVDLYNRHPDTVYEDLNQSNLSSEWSKIKGNSTLTWSEAQEAVKDAYNRLYDNRNVSGNSTSPDNTTR
jgi:hypothetical protein